MKVKPLLIIFLVVALFSPAPGYSQGLHGLQRLTTDKTAPADPEEVVVADDEEAEAPAADSESTNEQAEPAMAPGEWEIWLDMNNQIYPSWLLSTATMKSDTPNEENELGDPFGTIGIIICAPKDNCQLDMTVSSAKIIRPTRFHAVLKKAGINYFIRPKLDFDYDTLAQITQPFPENIKMAVSIDGKPAVEKLETSTVRAINDCIFSYPDEDGNPIEINWTFAAYVNENHPQIHRIMAKAQDSDGKPMTFAGYQGDKNAVLQEIEAVWNVIEERGLRYSSITTSSLAEGDVYGQFVRRIGEALKTKQANCVDGSVLLASILRRMGLDVYLIVLPDHMFIAVKLEADQDEVTSAAELTAIETTVLGNGSFSDALAEGKSGLKAISRKLKKALKDEDMVVDGCAVVDIAAARDFGVFPLREPDAK